MAVSEWRVSCSWSGSCSILDLGTDAERLAWAESQRGGWRGWQWGHSGVPAPHLSTAAPPMESPPTATGCPRRLAGHLCPTEGCQAGGRTPRGDGKPSPLKHATHLPPQPLLSLILSLRSLPPGALGSGPTQRGRSGAGFPPVVLGVEERPGESTLDVNLTGPARSVPQPAGPSTPGRAHPHHADRGQVGEEGGRSRWCCRGGKALLWSAGWLFRPLRSQGHPSCE